MRVSNDQNTVTLRAVFTEGGGCYDCTFKYLENCAASNERPCSPSYRIDGKDGHFKEVTGDE